MSPSASAEPLEHNKHVARVECERIAEFWAQPDQLGLLKKLGGRVVTDAPAAEAP